MLSFNRFKPLGPVLLTVMLISACIFFAFYWGAEDATGFAINSYRRNIKLQRKRAELVLVLKSAAMPNRTVIITSLNEAWSAPNSMVDLFLESFRVGEGTQRFLDHLLIVTMDDKSLERCKSMHHICYSLRIGGVDFSAEKRYMSPDYLEWMWIRLAFLRTVLDLGYNFVFTDADIMWLRNPFPRFPSTDGMTIDIAMAADFYTGNSADMGNAANAGFNYVISNGRSLQFYDYWIMSRLRYPGKNEQVVFDMIKNDKAVKRIGTQIRFLDPAYIGGFCRRPNFSNVCTMHANCCIGMENKLHDLRLVLEDWRNFTALSEDDKRGKNYTWRAPSKCKF